MSDQLFLGSAPKSDEGNEYYFYSMDDWIEIHRFLQSEMDYEFPPHPCMDEENAEFFAERLQILVNFGIAHAYFVLSLRTRNLMENEENPEGSLGVPSWPGEDSEELVRMINLIQGFIRFLRVCGGFKVDGCGD